MTFVICYNEYCEILEISGVDYRVISVIIPTLGTRSVELERLFKSLETQTNKNFEAIVVSQDNHELVVDLLSNYRFSNKHIKINRKGLSHSRNVGLKHISGTIVTFSDDDCWYDDDSFSIVEQTFSENTCDIACFQIFDPISNQYYKNYSQTPEATVSNKSLFRKSSIEIFLNLKNIDKEKLKFDENFGLGAKYPSGEENIFLSDMKKQNMLISYFPRKIVYHLKPNIATRLTPKSFIGKGPMFKRIYNTPVALCILFLFFFKKFRHLENPFSLLIKSIKETLLYKK